MNPEREDSTECAITYNPFANVEVDIDESEAILWDVLKTGGINVELVRRRKNTNEKALTPRLDGNIGEKYLHVFVGLRRTKLPRRADFFLVVCFINKNHTKRPTPAEVFLG